MLHKLKTWPKEFEATRLNAKKFEVRRDDRGFKFGDILLLQEWDPETEEYTGRELRVLVDYILRDRIEFGLRDGYMIMSIVKEEDQ